VRPEHFPASRNPRLALENATDQVNEFQVWKAAGRSFAPGRTRPI
jgi:hypothetical protein